MANTVINSQAAAAALTAASEEIARLRRELIRARSDQRITAARYAELLAGCRAAVAAARDGELDPLSYVRGPLEEHGQMPAPGQHPMQLLALGYRAGGEQQ